MKRLLPLFLVLPALSATAAPPPDTLRRTASVFVETPVGNQPDYLQMIGVQYENKVGRSRSFRVSLAIADMQQTIIPFYEKTTFPTLVNTIQKGNVALLSGGFMWSTPGYKGFAGYAGPELRFGVGFNPSLEGRATSTPFYYMGFSGVAGGRFSFGRAFINVEVSNGFKGVFTRQLRVTGEQAWQGDGSIDFNAAQFRAGVGYQF